MVMWIPSEPQTGRPHITMPSFYLATYVDMLIYYQHQQLRQCHYLLAAYIYELPFLCVPKFLGAKLVPGDCWRIAWVYDSHSRTIIRLNSEGAAEML